MSEGAKVVSLRGEPVPGMGQAVPNVVAFAEDLLERARAGDVVAISAATGHADGTASYRHEGRVSFGLLGALAQLQASLSYGLGFSEITEITER